MIDIESEVFTKVALAVRTAYPDAYVAGEYVNMPPRFPAISIEELDNTVKRSAMDNTTIENYADVMYQVDIYSNRTKGKKAECRAIAMIIDNEFAKMGFIRNYYNPVPNVNDATIYRITARYVASVSTDKTIYRR